MITRKEPPYYCHGIPCSNVAVSCALGTLVRKQTSHDDGWMTLEDQNKFIRENLPVQKSIYYKRGERPKLKDFLHDRSENMIICVYGHCIYAEGETYWSFFDNDNDDVVRVWLLKQPNKQDDINKQKQ